MQGVRCPRTMPLPVCVSVEHIVRVRMIGAMGGGGARSTEAGAMTLSRRVAIGDGIACTLRIGAAAVVRNFSAAMPVSRMPPRPRSNVRALPGTRMKGEKSLIMVRAWWCTRRRGGGGCRKVTRAVLFVSAAPIFYSAARIRGISGRGVKSSAIYYLHTNSRLDI